MHFATLRFAAVLLAATALVSCKDGLDTRADPAGDGPVVKVWVSEAGAIELNGHPAGIDAVGKALDDLVKQKGVVYYGREAARAEPHPNASKVFTLILDHRLPIKLSAKRDFSSFVAPGR